MRFAHPEILWLFVLLPLLAFFRGRQGDMPALVFSSTSVVRAMAAAGKAKPGALLMLFRFAALSVLILALGRPQLGNTTTEIKASGIDVLLAVDVSGSMEAMDFSLDGRAANRLEAVKQVVTNFIEQRPNDRIGLLAFAGRPYLVSPLTLDHDWMLKRLESLRTGMIEDGTAIGSAIGSGVNRLRDQKSKSRIMILLTDGMNNSGSVPPPMAAEAAQNFNIKVYTIGAGTRGEAPMPIIDPFGQKRLVRAKVDIDEKTLKEVAQKTGAMYFRATDTASLEKIYDEINSMETTTRTIKKFENYQELFPYLLGIGLILLGGEILLRKNRLP